MHRARRQRLASQDWATLCFKVSEDQLHLTSKDTSQNLSISIDEVVAIEISGPGTTSSNAGVTGGGFGLEGAALGLVAASLINAVTSRTATNTFLRLATLRAEVYLHFTDIEPFALRMYLSAAVVQVDALRHQIAPRGVGLSDEIAALKVLLDEGTLTAEEFQPGKAKLLGASA
ncbi:hypothetical protein CR105_26365 [Massilia eurypsychrophila]|uniref:SHOCT domain-containing protein n=1 Tax=Massilia eurypsychrophila TaxID=1485217 RepID=A0A2G8T7M6_9BURK|nr:SHOCT domain-containing protein [Massilia eurypsychrophila]PIL42050.1 hypothetical protein CR105_26365 [Massilia eurypsychrophila]